jgi:hypothetical protein
MLLTICIPTLNRAERVYSLLQYLASHLKKDLASKVNIVISNNCSTDNTKKLLSKSFAPGIEIVHRDQFIDTAEEHILTLINEVDSEYIWILGDDDIPNLSTIDLLLSYLENDEIDIYVFNHSEILADGSLLTQQMLHLNQAYFDINGRKLPMIVGFISTFSMFSNVVFRKKFLNIETGRNLLKLSPIYSHVAWYIIEFNEKRARVVSFPLVAHRADFKNINTYFEDLHIEKKQSKYHTWTTGLLHLINFLLENDYLDSAELSMVYESDFDGSRFRLVDRIIHFIYLRIKSSEKDKRSKNRSLSNIISDQEMAFFVSILVTIDARVQDQMFVLSKLNSEINKERYSWRVHRLLEQKFIYLHSAQASWLAYNQRSIGLVSIYSIFKLIKGYIAITNEDNYQSVYGPQLLNQVDPIERDGQVMVAESLEELLIKIQQQNSLGSVNPKNNFEIPEYSRQIKEYYLASYFALTPLRWLGKGMIMIRLYLLKFINKIKHFVMRRV